MHERRSRSNSEKSKNKWWWSTLWYFSLVELLLSKMMVNKTREEEKSNVLCRGKDQKWFRRTLFSYFFYCQLKVNLYEKDFMKTWNARRKVKIQRRLLAECSPYACDEQSRQAKRLVYCYFYSVHRGYAYFIAIAIISTLFQYLSFLASTLSGEATMSVENERITCSSRSLGINAKCQGEKQMIIWSKRMAGGIVLLFICRISWMRVDMVCLFVTLKLWLWNLKIMQNSFSFSGQVFGQIFQQHSKKRTTRRIHDVLQRKVICARSNKCMT